MAERVSELYDRLREIEIAFTNELRARGFDPDQLETTALPTSLAALAAERNAIQNELEDLKSTTTSSGCQNSELRMSELERLETQLKRAFEGGAWHGPAVMEVLEGVNAKKAAAHPIPGAHSIWELALHIGAWEGAGLRRLNGDRAQLPDEEDWPAIGDTSESSWQAVRQKLVEGNRKLRSKILTIDEAKLDQPILEGLASVYETLHGVVQHDLYHAGQIALLKRAGGE